MAAMTESHEDYDAIEDRLDALEERLDRCMELAQQILAELREGNDRA